MLMCMSCFGLADGNREWHGYPVCGDCFADLESGELVRRIHPVLNAKDAEE